MPPGSTRPSPWSAPRSARWPPDPPARNVDPSLLVTGNDGSAPRDMSFDVDPSLLVTGNDRSAGGRDMRQGVRIGLDPGDARIGVARSDPSGMLATPVETVARGRGDLARLAELVVEEQDGDPARVLEVVVGLP